MDCIAIQSPCPRHRRLSVRGVLCLVCAGVGAQQPQAWALERKRGARTRRQARGSRRGAQVGRRWGAQAGMRADVRARASAGHSGGRQQVRAAWACGGWARGAGDMRRQRRGRRAQRARPGRAGWPGLCTRCTPLGFQPGFSTRYFS